MNIEHQNDNIEPLIVNHNENFALNDGNNELQALHEKWENTAYFLKNSIKQTRLIRGKLEFSKYWLIWSGVLALINWIIIKNPENPYEIGFYTDEEDVIHIYNTFIKDNILGFMDAVIMALLSFISQFILTYSFKPGYINLFLNMIWFTKDIYCLIIFYGKFLVALKEAKNLEECYLQFLGGFFNPNLCLCIIRITVNQPATVYLVSYLNNDGTNISTTKKNFNEFFLLIFQIAILLVRYQALLVSCFFMILMFHFFVGYVSLFYLLILQFLGGFFFVYILGNGICESVSNIFFLKKIIWKCLKPRICCCLTNNIVRKKNEQYCSYLRVADWSAKNYAFMIIFYYLISISISFGIMIFQGCNYNSILYINFTFAMFGPRLTENSIQDFFSAIHLI